MIIFEQTLRELLIRTNLVDDRVFLMRAPQVPAEKQQIPYIVFFMVGPVDHIKHVTIHGALDQIERDYQFSVFDKSQSRALAIADSLRMYFDTMHGDFQNVHIGHCFYMTQTWAWESDTLLFQVIQEFRFMFNYLDLTGRPPVSPTAVPPVRRRRNEHHTSTATSTDTARRTGIPDKYAAPAAPDAAPECPEGRAG